MIAMQGYVSISIHSPFLSYSGKLIFFFKDKIFPAKRCCKKKVSPEKAARVGNSAWLSHLFVYLKGLGEFLVVKGEKWLPQEGKQQPQNLATDLYKALRSE